MPMIPKHLMSEEDIKLHYITPAVTARWNDTVQQLTEELGYNLDLCGYPHEEEEILAPLDLIQRYEEQRASLNAEIDRVLAEITEKLGGAEL